MTDDSWKQGPVTARNSFINGAVHLGCGWRIGVGPCSIVTWFRTAKERDLKFACRADAERAVQSLADMGVTNGWQLEQMSQMDVRRICTQDLAW